MSGSHAGPNWRDVTRLQLLGVQEALRVDICEVEQFCGIVQAVGVRDDGADLGAHQELGVCTGSGDAGRRAIRTMILDSGLFNSCCVP